MTLATSTSHIALTCWFRVFLVVASMLLSDAAFCEGKVGGIFRGTIDAESSQLPEYGNSMSAWMMTIVGIHMLLFWDNDSVFFRLVAALMAINGVGSFIFHYSGRWGDLDADTMTFAVMLMSGYTFEELLESIWDARRESPPHHERLQRRILMAIVWIGLMLFAWWVMMGGKTFDGSHSFYNDGLFELSFGLPIVLMALTMGVVTSKDWFNHQYLKPEIRTFAAQRFRWGFALCLLPLPTYFACEKMCKTSSFTSWFPGHVIWHLLMPIGMMNMLLLVSLLRADNMRQFPVIKNWRVHGIYFAIFPAFHFEAVESVARLSIELESAGRNPEHLQHQRSTPQLNKDPSAVSLPPSLLGHEMMGAKESGRTPTSRSIRVGEAEEMDVADRTERGQVELKEDSGPHSL